MQPDRATQVKRYIMLDAFASVISAADVVMLTVGDGFGENNTQLYNTLWPDDDDFKSVEFLMAEVQTAALEARLLSLFASEESREWMISEAARRAERAGRLAADAAKRNEVVTVDG